MSDSFEEAQEKARTKIQSPPSSVDQPFPTLGDQKALGESRQPRLNTIVLFFVAGLLALWALWTYRPNSNVSYEPEPAAVFIPQQAQAPVATPEAPVKKGFQLQGIIVWSGESYAMIGEEILSTGDKIGDYSIKGITSNSVVIEDAEGKRQVLRLPHEELPL